VVAPPLDALGVNEALDLLCRLLATIFRYSSRHDNAELTDSCMPSVSGSIAVCHSPLDKYFKYFI